MLTVAHVALTTLGTLLMIGLGFLARPCRATVLWSVAFMAAMVSSYGTIAADQLGSAPLRAASVGMLLVSPALIWSGLRADREAASLWWVSALYGAASAVLLAGVVGSPAYSLVFRLDFAAAAVFAALTVWELTRRPERGRGPALPLLLFSIVFVVMSVFSLTALLVAPGVGIGDLEWLGAVNALGMLVYIMCATVTLLFFSRGDPRQGTADAVSSFRSVATGRLDRARDADDRAWVMLEIRLDDTDDLRAAAGDSGFHAAVDRFESLVRTSLPADADVGRMEDGCLAVLIPRREAVMRQIMRRMLRRIADATPVPPLAATLSASVGYASVEEAGYDFDRLRSAAGTAADRASAEGGDRWAHAPRPVAGERSAPSST